MNKALKVIMLAIIVCGLYLGIRYVGSVIHYACAVPEEDCPPPFRIMGNLGFYVTGGRLVPLYRQN